MKKKLKIGIVGCGAIGSSLARFIVTEMSRECVLAAVYDVDHSKAQVLAVSVAPGKPAAVGTLAQLIGRSQIVIEAASARASWEIARDALRRKRDCMVMSVGGIIGRLKELTELARENGARVYIPSGAISGIDAVKASRAGSIKRVVLVTHKSPASFKGVPYVEKSGVDLGGLKKSAVLFSGTAREAVRYFPQNINVAAVLSLAGIGAAKTRVEIVADPFLSRNVHEILVESAAGTVSTRTENVLHPDNPKTSYLAVLSALAMLKQIVNPVRIGT